MPDDVDACPDLAGAASVDPRKNGCPAAFVKGTTITTLDPIAFRAASHDLTPESDPVLVAVAEYLTRTPQLRKIAIETHADPDMPAAAAKRLSARRAEAVVRWLVAHGVGKERLVAAPRGHERVMETGEGARAVVLRVLN